MRTLLTSLLLLPFLLHAQTGYKEYPSYETVVRQFFGSYSAPSGVILRFEKRPDGWHAVTLDYTTGAPQASADGLLWSREKKNFQPLTRWQKSRAEENNAENFLQQWDAAFYSVCPYYGYTGWDKDVIDEYKDAADLPDSIVYGLARAYSSYAGNLLSNNSGFADSSRMFRLPEGKNSMTQEQLDTYRFYSHKAVETYERLNRMNPAFETMVGVASDKLANEHVTAFLDLSVYQNEEEARKELKENIYSGFLLALARNYLMSCPQNAILFTNGDNDTYPLLYVQAMYGYRTDVLVANLSLLNTGRYTNHLREQVFGQPGLSLSFSPGEVSGKQTEVVLVDQTEKYYELKDALQYARDKSKVNMYGYYHIPGSLRYTVSSHPMQWKMDKYYLYRGDLMTLDIVASNKRPICFTRSVFSDAWLGMNDYLQTEGMIERLVPEEKKAPVSPFPAINAERTYTLLQNFEWKEINPANSSEKRMAENYRNLFVQLALGYIAENKKSMALEMMDKAMELFPPQKLPYTTLAAYMIDAYYQLGEFKKGNGIAEVFIKEMDATEMENEQAIREYLVSIAGKYGQAEILRKLEDKN